MKLIALVAVLLCGCASINKNPIDIECKGKGTISGQGYTGVGMFGSGHESTTFTITADCGDGFTIKSFDPTMRKGSDNTLSINATRSNRLPVDGGKALP